MLPPEAFGDNWHEPLTGDDVARARQYFQSIEHLRDSFDFIQLRVGGQDHSIDLARKKFNRGVTFEAPRGSLMCAIDNEIFDDMLIGNFMKTTLHGDWGPGGLYPDFCPYVPKYADNGRARTRRELDAYFAEYGGAWAGEARSTRCATGSKHARRICSVRMCRASQPSTRRPSTSIIGCVGFERGAA